MLRNNPVEELYEIIKDICLPICQGNDTVGETRLCPTTAYQLANKLHDSGCTKQREGKWKLLSDGTGICNQCNFTQVNVWDLDSFQRYCGVCGAKMSLEND
jgi:hypothetical protein